MTVTDEAISTIVHELFPEADDPLDDDYDFLRNELAKLAPELLEKIADRLAWHIGLKICAVRSTEAM